MMNAMQLYGNCPGFRERQAARLPYNLSFRAKSPAKP
jgi:hypothetical protein